MRNPRAFDQSTEWGSTDFAGRPDNFHVVTREKLGIARRPRDGFFLCDARRYVPVRAEHDLCHLVCEDGRLVVGGADNHAHVHDARAVLDGFEAEVRDVHDQVSLRHCVRQPPPALEVQLDGANPLCDRDVECRDRFSRERAVGPDAMPFLKSLHRINVGVRDTSHRDAFRGLDPDRLPSRAGVEAPASRRTLSRLQPRAGGDRRPAAF